MREFNKTFMCTLGDAHAAFNFAATLGKCLFKLNQMYIFNFWYVKHV